MEAEICPFCGKKEYMTYEGDTIDVGFGDNYQIAPDEYECVYCGFKDKQDNELPIEQLIKKYKKEIKKEIKANLEWCIYMVRRL